MATATNCIDPAVQELLELFEGPLKQVQFPGVGDGTLGELAEGLERATTEVARLETLLTSARSTVDEQRQSLLARCQRALSYARIYAEDAPELREQLDRIRLPAQRTKDAGVARKPRATKAAVTDAGESVSGIEAAQSGEEKPVGRKRGRPSASVLALPTDTEMSVAS